MNNMIPTVMSVEVNDIVEAVMVRMSPLMRLSLTNQDLIIMLLKNL